MGRLLSAVRRDLIPKTQKPKPVIGREFDAAEHERAMARVYNTDFYRDDGDDAHPFEVGG